LNHYSWIELHIPAGEITCIEELAKSIVYGSDLGHENDEHEPEYEELALLMLMM